jgi:hypothetical protein
MTKNTIEWFLAPVTLALLASFANAEVDGSLDAGYPAIPLAVQNNGTSFGDNDDPDPLASNGSELDVLHAYVTETDLHVFIGGNLGNSYEKFELFIDAFDGGQNTVRFDNADVDYNALGRMGGGAFVGGALVFDQEFSPDFYLTCAIGGDPLALFASAATMPTDGGGVGVFLGSTTDNPNGLGGILSDTGIQVAVNNSNIDGVGAGDGSDDGSGVTSGIEIMIPLAILPDLYTPGDGMKLLAFINDPDHGFASNQFMSGLGGSTNLGEVRRVDLSQVPGCQFVVLDGDPGGYPCAPGDGGGDVPGEPSVLMDGIVDGAYEAAVGIQDTMTNFGDASIGLADFCDGSEIDAIHGMIDEERLNLFMTGNVQSNYNHLEIFIDFADGGQQQVRGDNPGTNFNALGRMGDDGTGNGLRFDDGFEADVYFEFNCGGEKDFGFYASASQMLTDGGGIGLELGGAGSGEVLSNFNGMQCAINNSNVGGVIGGTDLDDGSGVISGVEISIPLERLEGYAGGDIRVCAFINSNDHGYMSNQVIGGIGGGDNLEDPRLVDFAAIEGDQFVVISVGGNDCPGDLDGNGTVDGADLTILLGNWGGMSDGDLDGNGSVDGADLTMLLGNWGLCS